MNKFGERSREELETAHTKLQQIAAIVLQLKDHSVLKGHRTEQEQNAAFYAMPQRTKLKFPDGKHNGYPSLALDVQSYPVPHTTEQALREEQLYLLGLYVGVGAGMGITIRTGADWDRDGEISDNGFDDFFHVEYVGARQL